MLTILLIASATFITEPKSPLPPPVQLIEIRNKEGLSPEDRLKRKMKEKSVKDRQQKFFTSFLNNKTKVGIAQSRRPVNVRNKEGLAAADRAKRRIKDKMSKTGNKSS